MSNIAKQKHIVAVLLFLLAFLLRLPCLLPTVERPPSGLEEIYLTQALSFLYGNGMRYDPELRKSVDKFGSGIAKDFTLAKGGPIYYMPGYPAVEAFVIHLFGEKTWIIRLIGALVDSFAVVLLFLTVLWASGGQSIVAIIAGILFATDQALPHLSVLATADSVQMFFVALWLLLFFLYLRKRKLVYLIAFGAAFGLHALFRLDFAPLIFVIALWSAFVFGKQIGLRLFAVGAGFVLLFVLPVGIRNAFYTGHFYITPAGSFVALVGTMEGEKSAEGLSGDSLAIATVGKHCGTYNMADPKFAMCARSLFGQRVKASPTKYLKQMMRRAYWSFKRAFVYSGGECFYAATNSKPFLGAFVKGKTNSPNDFKWYVLLYEVFKFGLLLLLWVGIVAAVELEHRNATMWLFLLLALFYIVFHLPLHTESRFVLPARIFFLCASAIGLNALFSKALARFHLQF